MSSTALTLNETHDWTSEYRSDDPVRGKAIRFVTDHYVVGREKSALPPDHQYIVIELSRRLASARSRF